MWQRRLFILLQLIATLLFTLTVIEVQKIVTSKGAITAMLILAVISFILGTACFVGVLFVGRKLKRSTY